MSFGELKKAVNSDLTGDPVNCIVYINSIESEGSSSYILDKRNSNLWRELITQSVAAFKVFSIHEIMYERFTEADIDYMIERNPRLGECLNNYYEEEIFPTGNIDEIVLNISDDKLDKIEGKFRDGIVRYLKKELLADGVCEWIAEKYNIPDIASYSTIKEFAAVKSVVDQVYANAQLMEFLKYTGDFMNPIANDGELMIDLLERESVVAFVEKCDLWMHEILESNVGLGKFVSYKASFALTAYTNYDAIIDKTSAITTVTSNEEVLSYVQRSDLGIAKTIIWRIGGNGTSVNSMAEVMSDPTKVTQIAESNGTTTDAIAILKNSIPGMVAAIASDEISAVVLNTLNVDAPSVAYACIMSEIGLTRFDSETYGDLYAKIFDVQATMEFLVVKKEVVTQILDTPKLFRKFSESEVSLTAFCTDTIGVHCLDDNDVAKKALLDNELAASKIVENGASFSYIIKHMRWAEFVAYSYPMLNNIVSDTEKITTIMEMPGWRSVLLKSWLALDLIMNSSAAIKALKENVSDFQSFLDVLIESDTLTKYLTNMTSIFGSDTIVSELSKDNVLLKVVTNSTSAMSSIMDSAVGMVSVSDSTSAMHAIANSKVLVRSLIASESAFMAVIYSEVAMKEIAASEIAMQLITANGTRMNYIAASSVARTALYNAASITEPILAASSTAIAALKASSQCVEVSCVGSNGSWQTSYAGKAFVLEVWCNNNGNYTSYHGDYIIGTSRLSFGSTTTHQPVKKFASTVTGAFSASGWASCALIFKI